MDLIYTAQLYTINKYIYTDFYIHYLNRVYMILIYSLCRTVKKKKVRKLYALIFVHKFFFV
jgi:hypothetical protein